jgi:hypothetical protein
MRKELKMRKVLSLIMGGVLLASVANFSAFDVFADDGDNTMNVSLQTEVPTVSGNYTVNIPGTITLSQEEIVAGGSMSTFASGTTDISMSSFSGNIGNVKLYLSASENVNGDGFPAIKNGNGELLSLYLELDGADVDLDETGDTCHFDFFDGGSETLSITTDAYEAPVDEGGILSYSGSLTFTVEGQIATDE